jgi:hypothetical protein
VLDAGVLGRAHAFLFKDIYGHAFGRESLHELGLTRYRHNCTICADVRPTPRVAKGSPTRDQTVRRPLKVKKWSATARRALLLGENQTDCAICMRGLPVQPSPQRHGLVLVGNGGAMLRSGGPKTFSACNKPETVDVVGIALDLSYACS